MRGKTEWISAKSVLTIKPNGLNRFLAVAILVRPLRWFFTEQDGIRFLYGCWSIDPPRELCVSLPG